MICDTCKQRKECDIQVNHVVNTGCRLHIEDTLNDCEEKMDLNYIMDFMNRIWLMVSMIAVGVVMGMILLQETIETGLQFLFINFMMCYFWMSYILWRYEQELLEDEESDKDVSKIESEIS